MSAKDNDVTDKRAPESDVYTDKVDSGYVESNTAPAADQSLQRQLKNRHIAMIRYFQLFSPLDPYFC
jgi:amino acid permease